MTKEQKMEAFEMLLDGQPITAVADKFGVSRQYISQWVRVSGIRLNEAAKKCVYPNIASWMVESNVGYSKMARLMGSETHSVTYNLTHAGAIKKNLIDKILKLTGFTYEYAFYSEEN